MKNFKRMIKVAITGGIGVGKTALCNLFKNYDSFVVDTDKIAHTLLSPNNPVGKKIIKIFGAKKIIKNNEIDRKALAKIVFSNKKLLAIFEKIIHPPIIKEIKKIYKIAKISKKYKFFVVENALVFEIKENKRYDYVILVTSKEKNHSLSKEDYLNRMRRQIPQKIKESKADFIIKNNGTLDELNQKVKKICIKMENKWVKKKTKKKLKKRQ